MRVDPSGESGMKRARVETVMSRFKRVIGDGLCSRTDERRASEVDVAVHVLNRMLELGRPNYVPSPNPGWGRGRCARSPIRATQPLTSVLNRVWFEKRSFSSS